MESIKSDPTLKILDVASNIGQHGGEVLKQQQNLSKVREALDRLSKQLAWQIAAEDKIHTYWEKVKP
jgi:hypothetical protein